MSKTFYLCIYNPLTKEVELHKEVNESTRVDEEVKSYEEVKGGKPGERGKEIPDPSPLYKYDLWRYENECRGRGGAWVPYCSDKPFDWEIVLPQPAKVLPVALAEIEEKK